MDPISTQLGEGNYSTWKEEVTEKIAAHNLEKFFVFADLGGRPIDSSEEEYNKWKEQDQVLYNWLIASLSSEIRGRLETCEYALELWKVIELYFVDKEIEDLRSKYKNLLKDSHALHMMRMCLNSANKTTEDEVNKESSDSDSPASA